MLMFGRVIALSFAQTSLLALCMLLRRPFLRAVDAHCVTSLVFHPLHLGLQIHAARGIGSARR